ncbi:unnamed protein product, partial [marine sediment metagenome]
EILKKIEKLLRSPNIEFVIEYLDRGNKSRKMEALDVRLGRIIPDIGSKKITIQLYLNDVQEGYGWMDEKRGILKKIEKLLRSPNIEFVIEYLDRGNKSRKMDIKIH